MPPRRTRSAVSAEPTAAGYPDGEPTPVVRRAPFADNPTVGARGQRTQQRILDAALKVFGDEGYHQCSIDRITKLAGCSRVSFYQYFSGKEDVFRNLTGQVARQLNASTEALEPLTPDRAGWDSLRGWVARHGDIYDRYEPVFHVFPQAAEIDEAVARGSARVGRRTVAMIRSRMAASTDTDRQLDAMIGLLFESVNRTFDIARLLRSWAPEAYPPARVEDSLTDVMHRSLFGVLPDVNVHPPAPTRPPTFEFRPEMWANLQGDGEAVAAGPNARKAQAALVETGRDVFLTRGYHGTRVDDLAAAAGVSHGAFYRYFRNKDDLALLFVARAIRAISTAFVDIPDVISPATSGKPAASGKDDGAAGQAALRRWLRRYNAVHLDEAAMVRVWIDATLQDSSLIVDSVPALDWGRRRMVRYLEPRGFGDVDTDAVIMVSLISGFGAEPRSPAAVDGGARIIERGLCGR